MKIILCDVNLGECILCLDRRRLLVINCGARFGQRNDTARQTAAVAFQARLEELEEKRPLTEKGLVITQMDAEHINGLAELPEKTTLDWVCLPLYPFVEGETEGSYQDGGLFYRAAMTQAALYLTGHSGGLLALQGALLALPRLTQPERVRCLAQGDILQAMGTRLEVLWSARAVQHRTEGEGLSLFLRGVLAEAMRNRNRGEEEQRQVLQTLENYALALLHLYAWYATDHRENEERIRRENRLREAFSALESLPRLEMNRSEAGQSGFVTRELTKALNSSSLVLAKRDEVLFCGEVADEVLCYLKSMGKLAGRYRVIKPPGHGKQVGENLPEGEILLLFNSGIHGMEEAISLDILKARVETFCCTNNNGGRCRVYREGFASSQCAECNIWRAESFRSIEIKKGKCPVFIK